MSNNIKIKIDVTKIDKNRLFHSEKTGAKYLDAVLIETPNGQYSDFMIVESVSKEEREAGVKGTIIGNGYYFHKPTQSKAVEDAELLDDDNESDLPF